MKKPERVDGGPEILVVDDSHENLLLLEGILSDAGFLVRSADSGSLALRSARARAPDLVLLDIRMPGIDGFEVCRVLMSEEGTRNVPVLFISGLEDAHARIQGFQAGGVDFVGKPFQAEEVLARVRTHLALKSAREDLEKKNAELVKARDTLEEEVRRRTAELEKANRSLLTEIRDREKSDAALRESESRYRHLFEDLPISLWVEDLSGVKEYLDSIRKREDPELRRYLSERPEIVEECIRRIRVLDVNKASLELFRASNKEELLAGIETVVDPGRASEIVDELVWIAEGRTGFEWEGCNRKLSGDLIDVWMHLSAAPGYEDSLARVLIAIEDVTERKRGEERVRKALAEKEVLLRELYHRTRNNMQVISSMISLQADYVPDLELTGYMTNIQNRILVIARVHEMLYESGNLDRINLKDYLRDIGTALLTSLSPEDCTVKLDTSCMDDIEISLDAAIPCGMAVNELITNSLKHAFGGRMSGMISLSLRREDADGVLIRVADDGNGVPAGFDFRTQTRLGYFLVFSLVEEQLHGRVTMETKPELSCTLEFRNSSVTESNRRHP